MDDTSGRVKREGAWPGAAASDDAPRSDQMIGRTSESARAYATDRDDAATAAAADERAREIRDDIEATRSEMSETIDAIQDKLKPANIVAGAKDRVKTAAAEKVRAVADTAGETAQQAMDYTRDAMGGVAGTARQNPIPLALIGIGAAWLLTNRARNREALRRDREDDWVYQREPSDYEL
jgi:MoxR-like ATPase